MRHGSVSDASNTDENWLEHIALSQAMEKLGAGGRKILAMRFFEGKRKMRVFGHRNKPGSGFKA